MAEVANKLAIELDDHEWLMIVSSLRREAIHLTNTTGVLYLNLALRLESSIVGYQERESAVLSELREIRQQIAATMDKLEDEEEQKIESFRDHKRRATTLRFP